MTPTYIHLRLHTEYSLSDGIVQISSLVEKAAQDKMPAVAITDQSNLFGIVKFYKEALAAGIKPIIGVDIWLYNEKQPKHPFRATLLCQNNIGYQNLLCLISKSFIEGQTLEKAIVQYEWLATYAEGLIALSGAQDGDIGHALIEKQSTESLLTFWKTHFPDRFYLELRRVGQPQEELYNQAALTLAETQQLPVIATNDMRFIDADDFEAHEARVCIHEGFILADPRRPKRYTDQQYFRSQQDMATLFADIPEALENTIEIAKRCNISLTLGKNFLPRFEVPERFTTESYLAHVAKEGLEKRLAILFDVTTDTFSTERQPYDARLTMETDIINNMGFAGYFLIVADFTRWARNNGVPVGPGRGSGPGSLVAYSLGITDLDPLAHDLLFERFLNPERVSMPDFDIDFCMEGRDRVIDYVMRTHGHESVSQIITYGTMAARAVVRDVGRVLGLGYGQVDKIAKLIPFEIGVTLEKALEQEEQLRNCYNNEEEIKTLIDLARKLEGITRNVGKHAGGVVIAPGKLTDFAPLYCEAGHPDHVVTQFDKDDVEAVGLVKFDFLGLRTLTIIDWAVQQANRMRHEKNEPPIDLQLIPMNDADTYTMLKACQTTAVFQLESRGMKDLVKRLQPDCFEDIVALVALFRPGPLQSGMVDDFINRKHGRARVEYPHPKLEPILKPTYGVIVYQEQVMQIAQVLAGYSLGAADLLRRAMGKKKAEEMAQQREIFCKGSVENNVPFDVAAPIFDLMEKFAGYGFNKSHSASYALIAYQTAWLKAHYPAAYMASVLSADMDHTDKVVHFVEECSALKLALISPDVNFCDYHFTVIDDTTLAYGLGAIKGAGQAAMEDIITARKKDGPFIDLFDFCRRVDLRKCNRRVIEALIKAGAFDKIGPHRASLFTSIDLALQQAEQHTKAKSVGQHDIFGGGTVQPPKMDYIDIAKWSDHQRLFGEKETLGLYLSGHPIHRYLDELGEFTHDRLINLRPATNQMIIAAGIITSTRTIQTKRGDRMAVATLDDASGQIDLLCFSDVYQRFRELLVKDKLIVLEGEVSFDDFSGGNRIICREMYSLEQARERFGKHLRITLPASHCHDMTQLANLLSSHKGGNCRVVVNYQRDDAMVNVKLGDTWRVRPTDALLNALSQMLDEAAVGVVY